MRIAERVAFECRKNGHWDDATSKRYSAPDRGSSRARSNMIGQGAAVGFDGKKRGASEV
jgi:hypothetical protein